MPGEQPFDVKAFLKSLTTLPGVYRMYDASGVVIYVGKARNLKKRVSSYFRGAGLNAKTLALVAQIHHIEVATTRTEGEALLLEQNLIKEHQPRYNVLLRDDKSYPYIFLSTGDFPRLAFHRGARRAAGRYFGPYPSSVSVRETLHLLQKLFLIRQCEDSFFSNRSRPCLQYQIKRCTAPCVGLITPEHYAEDVRHAVMFLEGRSQQVVTDLAGRMDAAAAALEFELAARYRDQIANLRRVQEKQYVSGAGGNVDVIAAVAEGGVACVQIFFVRDGRNLGNRVYFPRHAEGVEPTGVLSSFLAQYYLGGRGSSDMPRDILVSEFPEDGGVLEEVLTQQAGHRVQISSRVRGVRARWVEMAVENARVAVRSRLASTASVLHRFEALQEALQLDAVPSRIECFDVSHTMGTETVASCVVMDHTGLVKSDYRRFNIKDVAPGDDYGAMRQAISRRYTRLKDGEGCLPDILLIDGGKGQVAEAERVLEELQITGVTLVGISKGPDRRPGQEILVLSGGAAPFILPAQSPALHLLQQARDEAHRFAITAHRQRRAKARTTSPLEGISGLGPKRRQQLLRHFGGLQEVARAGVEDLASVPGLSRALAQRIYDSLHADT